MRNPRAHLINLEPVFAAYYGAAFEAKDKFTSKVYPSRILNLGLYILISNSKDFRDKNETERNNMISDIFEKLNLSYSKAEKDIGIYESSISKMEQAKELIEELKVKDKKKVNKQ